MNRVRVIAEDVIERVVTCENPDCASDIGCESLLFHEPRHHYENFDFNSENETFFCRTCHRPALEEFEIVEDGLSVPIYQAWIADA
jgi:hypothetical protein